MPVSPLATLADRLTARAHVPYSQTPAAAALLLRDGRYVPGVRLENASFPLTIPAVVAALVGAQALGVRTEAVALALSRPIRDDEVLLLSEALDAPLQRVGDALVRVDAAGTPLPTPTDAVGWSPRSLATPADGIAAARLAGAQALVPASNFPVGCALATEEGVTVTGANVEFVDWTRGLCAERSALAAAWSYGLTPTVAYVSCLDAPGGTPCGACRQVLSELLPGGPIWVDQGAAPPTRTTTADLLPDAFGETSLQAPRA